MNFDDDDDSDFNFTSQANNSKLASLFKSSNEDQSDETLKYKAEKQPQPAQQTNSNHNQSQSASTSVLFFSGVQAYKYVNNAYAPQGKLGLAVLSNKLNNQVQYRILLYVTRTQPVATIRIGLDFKISIQKNNYAQFYDESKQIWSILFDTEDLVANFATQITLCKCNLLQGNLENSKLYQDLKLSDSDPNIFVEANDSVEVTTQVSLWKELKLVEIENTVEKPFRLKLGKNKLPQIIEDLIVRMKQGDRKLFVLSGNYLKSFYPNNISSNSVVFYDITILRIKKNTNKDERNISNTTNIEQMPPLPQLNFDQESRSRSESIKEKTKIINEQINDPKHEKARVISRMAKLGQQMLPSGSSNLTGLENEEEWSGSSQMTSEINQNLQQNLAQQQQQQQQIAFLQEAQASKQALLLQNQHLQQQLAFQSQLAQTQTQTTNNQLALFKSQPQINNQQLFMYPNQANLIDPNIQHISQTLQPQQQINQTNQTSQEITSSLQAKLDLITEKLDQIKSITNLNNQNMPSMETSILLQNIQRIVKENEQYKKELYEKSSKIEEQNLKITDLLMKAQNYVEQSHQILELKNNSFQTNAEKTQQRILELEQDKMKLTNELTQLTGQISELNLEINKMKKEDLEMRKQLSDVSKNTDQHKQNSERLVVENADLQTKLDTVMSELKKERHLRKTNETKLQLNEEELNELRSNLASTQKLIEEKKRKLELDRSQFDMELEEIKRTHLSEINLLKERLTKAKTNLNESQNEQIKQIEIDLNRDWQMKLEKSIQQTEQKYERKINELNEENLNLKAQINELNETQKGARSNLTNLEAENDNLKHSLEDYKLFKDKYERLQTQALNMKERYENRIKELLDAEPDSEIVGEEVKKLMNAMYKKLKSQIRPDQYYSGNGILIAMLRIIKMITLQLLSSKGDGESQTEEEDVDYFSQHIYKAPEVIQSTPTKTHTPIQISTNQENQMVEDTPSLSTFIKLTMTSQNLIESMPKGEDQLDHIKQEETESKKEDLDEKNENMSKMEGEEKQEDDDDIQLINDEEEEKEQSVVNDTVYQIETIKQSGQIGQEESKQEEINSSQPDQVLNSSESDENIDVIEETEQDNEKENFVSIVPESQDDSQMNTNMEEVEKIEKEETNFDSQVEEKNKENEKKFVENNKTIPSKGLFDDDENEEDDELFSFSKIKPVNKIENETEIISHDPFKEEPVEPKIVVSNESKSRSNTQTTPLNLKFSPPPLFDDEEEDNNDKDIDWFK